MNETLSELEARLRKVEMFIPEEKDTSKLYAKMGYKMQGHQEHQHALFFEKERDRIKAKIRELQK